MTSTIELTERETALNALLERFPASTFNFDPRIKTGHYTDHYFLETRETVAFAGRDGEVTMQVFAKRHGIVAGIPEAIRLLETQLARGYSREDLVIETLLDGDPVEPWDTIMHIKGPALAFLHLETVYLGVLARPMLVATNMKHVVDAANGKPVIFMGARHDHWRLQQVDGYSAMLGGAAAVSTDANGEWIGIKGTGTQPHALIAMFHGDSPEATVQMAHKLRAQNSDLKLVALVDYKNDVIAHSLLVARRMWREFGPDSLYGVRVDTSEKNVDKSFQDRANWFPGEKLTGVNPRLVRELRAALDAEGFQSVRIIVSGGFTPTKIRAFEEAGVPVDVYGVGSSVLGHNSGEADGMLNSFDATADIVILDGVPESKTGREFKANPRLVRVHWTS